MLLYEMSLSLFDEQLLATFRLQVVIKKKLFKEQNNESVHFTSWTWDFEFKVSVFVNFATLH